MSKSVEEKYFEDFGNSSYDSALHKLWEDHCKYPDNHPWPPSLEKVKKEIDGEAWRDVGEWR